MNKSKCRLKKRGSDAGHNGLKSINNILNSSNYARLRFGIDNNFRPGYQSDYVLGEFSIEEKKDLIENIELSSSLIQPVTEIKSLGEFKVVLNLHSEIESFFKIKVVPEELIK